MDHDAPADACPGPNAIIAQARHAIVGVTVDGTIVSWNPAAEALFGYAASDVVGQPVAQLGLLPLFPPFGPTDQRLDSQEAVFRARDGETTAVTVTTSQVLNAAGEPFGCSHFIQTTAPRRWNDGDTQNSSVATALQRQLAHLSRLGAMGQLAPVLAHELKQPLTAIVTYLTSARRLLQPGPSKEMEIFSDILNEALIQARRADQIIRHLRSFVCDHPPEREPTDIAHLIADVGELVLIAARQAGVTLHQPSVMNARVLVDRVQLQQVLFNLMRNAIEAMAEGDVRDLRVFATRVDQMVQVSIVDTGPGLAPSVQARLTCAAPSPGPHALLGPGGRGPPHLFEPFVTTKSDGMGLGLSICRTIVEQHGGRLWFEPADGGGAAMHLTLPLDDIADGTAPP